MESKYLKSSKESTFFESEDTFSQVDDGNNLFGAAKRFLSGDVENEVGRVGLFRYLARNRFVFKLLGKALILRYPHDPKKFEDTYDTSLNKHLDNVLSYTIKRSAYKPILGVNRRTEPFYKYLSLPPRDLSSEKLLVIGGKDVAELFIAWTYGFKWSNIIGIDLFSLHPKIQIMDMEEMSFDDQSFDSVALCHTYGYQADKFRCLREIYRVLVTGGHLVFNSQFAADITQIGEGVNCNTSPSEMTTFFEQIGFTIIASTHKPNGPYINSLWLVEKA